MGPRTPLPRLVHLLPQTLHYLYRFYIDAWSALQLYCMHVYSSIIYTIGVAMEMHWVQVRRKHILCLIYTGKLQVHPQAEQESNF